MPRSNKEEFVAEFTELCRKHVDHLQLDPVLGYHMPTSLVFKDGTSLGIKALFKEAKFNI